MKTLLALAAALALAMPLSGCFGLPEGSADTGDTVVVRYTAVDLATGAKVRENRTASFAVGSGASGLGLAFERAVRGHSLNDTFEATIRSDPSLGFNEAVDVDRMLPPIAAHQNVSRADFDGSQFGPATVGKAFPAYGVYQGVVTAVRNTTVEFDVIATEGQEDPVPAVGGTLVSRIGAGEITRELRPTPGATFTVQPPSALQPRTPLGLDPGSYKVVGVVGDKVRFLRSIGTQADLIGKDLAFTVTLLRVTPADLPEGPVDGNYGVRSSPQVNGDPSSVLGAQTAGDHIH